MVNQQLIDYINNARESGMDDEGIKSELLNAGWQEADVIAALNPNPNNSAGATPPPPGSGATPPPPGSSAPESNAGSAQHNTGMAIISYLGILVLIPLVTDAKNDPYVNFHIKQGLALLIAGVIAGIVGIVPIIGWFLFPFLMVAMLIFTVWGIINAATGKMKELPIVGKLAHNFHF